MSRPGTRRPSETTVLQIDNVRPMGGDAVSLRIEGGRIVAMGAGLVAGGASIIDGGGAIALPGLVEAHTHLDKTLLGLGWHRHQAGSRLIDKIETERRLRRESGFDPERQSARQVVLSLSRGTTHIRTHVDVDTEIGVRGIEGVLAMRERFRDVMGIELVAFPQSGMLIRPGTAELMQTALGLGADVVGGLDPCAMDRDPKGHLDQVFAWAERFGRPIDIHLHEPGEMGAFSMELIIERTRALGLQGRVTISHAFCLGAPDPELVGPLIDGLARERIHIMTTGPASRPAPPVKRLREAGIVVCAGTDGVRDAWGPYGNADMLERAKHIGLRNNFRRDDEIELALDICTHGGATVMGLDGYGLVAGARADLVLVDAETVAEAVVAHPPRRLVVKSGRVVAKDGAPLVAVP